MTFAAGLACEGMKPVVAIYSTFLQRAYDQLIHDVALQNLPVVFAIDRAGIVGADGATHIGAFDLSYLRCLPNMTVMAPADENECRQMLYTAFTLDTPAAVRYPRGSGPGRRARGRDDARCRWARARCAATTSRRTNRIAILAFGSMLAAGARRPPRSSTRRSPTCASSSRSTPISCRSLAREHDALVTVEENVVAGGAGQRASAKRSPPRASLSRSCISGLPDAFVDHGDPAQLLARLRPRRQGHRRVDQRARFGHAADRIRCAKPAA